VAHLFSSNRLFLNYGNNYIKVDTVGHPFYIKSTDKKSMDGIVIDNNVTDKGVISIYIPHNKNMNVFIIKQCKVQ
jgi:hypothetical protein